jgi:hypothetical protein
MARIAPGSLADGRDALYEKVLERVPHRVDGDE